MSHCQQINSKPNQYVDYNQTINKIYFNPYSLHIYSQQTSSHKYPSMIRKSQIPMSSTNLGQNDNQNNQYFLNVGPFKSQGQIKDYYDGNVKNGYQSPRSGRLSVSQIFNENQMKWKKQKQVKIQQKPTINYFVTQFQRLQQQNKEFKKKIQELEKKTSGSQQSQVNISQMDLLYQNQKLKKELQQQRRRNTQKNQKISQLMDKINQIEEHMDLVVQSRSISQANQEQQTRRDEQKVLEEKKQFQEEINNIKNKFNESLQITVNSLLQKIKVLEGTLQQSVNKYKDLQTQVNNLNNTLLNI